MTSYLYTSCAIGFLALWAACFHVIELKEPPRIGHIAAIAMGVWALALVV